MPDNSTPAQGITSPSQSPEQEAETTIQEQPAETVSQAPALAQATAQPTVSEQEVSGHPSGEPTAKAELLSQPEEPIPPEEVQADLATLPANASGSAMPNASRPKQATSNGRLTSSLDYFASGTFNQDITKYRAYANRKTGYASLDSIQPFYPGLYLLGAISSLGKTTYALQLADQIAASGGYALIFSLEQNRFELFSKSIARGFFLTQKETNNSYPTPSSAEIRSGIASDKYMDKLAEQVERYKKAVGGHIGITDGMFSITVEDIVATVERFQDLNPVVIVDYLQIIQPSTSADGKRKLEGREAIDHIVHTLKALQSKYNLTVVVISSLNRQSYLTPIDFESFKESGGIEYTADVIWGLQLAVMSDELFSKDGKYKEKRDKIREAKADNPRAIDLVCVKNRFGQASYTVKFNYFPKSDTFEPCI